MGAKKKKEEKNADEVSVGSFFSLRNGTESRRGSRPMGSARMAASKRFSLRGFADSRIRGPEKVEKAGERDAKLNLAR